MRKPHGSGKSTGEAGAAVAKAGDLHWAQRTSRANAQTKRNLMIAGPTACVLSRDRVRSPVQTQDAIYWPSCAIPADLVLSLQ